MTEYVKSAIWKAKKHMQMCSVSLFIVNESTNNNEMSSHAMRMAYMKKTGNIEC